MMKNCMKPNYIIIDIRMLEHSGIGTYINNLVYRILNRLENYKFILLLNPSTDYSDFLKKMKYNNFKTIKIYSKIYSLTEQFEIPIKIPRKYLFYWSPHYNIPVLLNKNILVTIHDIYHLVDATIVNYPRKIYCYFMLKIIKYKKCNIISVSNFTKSELLKYTSIKNEQILVIYNGLENIWKSTSNYIENNDILLYVGNMKKHKNISLLIKAFNIINKTKKINLYLIGNNNGISNTTLKEINNNNNIFLKDSINKEKLLYYYNSAKIFVFPSNYEGFGFTPIEAMACGCPVIATNTASIPEICSNGALYFKKNNLDDLVKKINLIFNDKKIADDLVKKAYRVQKKFLWENTAINTINYLKKLLS